jgi:hypothetical protein
MNNPSAFPVLDFNPHPNAKRLECSDAGMTLRDWFAAQALSGLLISPSFAQGRDMFAKAAYQYADAMMEARK